MKKKITVICICILCSLTIAYADKNSPYRDGVIEGYIKNVSDNQIQIEEYDGTIHQLELDRKISFQIDGILANLQDFKPGMEVFGELKGRRLNYLESYSTENMGYIPADGKVRIGIVKKIDRDQISIKQDIGGEETYFTSPATITTREEENIELSALYEGDRVKLYFDEYDTTVISRIEIQGKSVLIKDIYRAKIAKADQLEDVIGLEDLEVLRNGKWEYVSKVTKIPYATELPLYIKGQKINHDRLKYYRGKTIYMVVKNFFGSDKVEKMIIKSEYESTYSDKIKRVNFYADAFELENKKNILLNEGTIIIKNGRLVDKNAINPDSDAYIVADGRGGNLFADIINIYNENINNSNIGQNYIYSGRLSKILEDKVYLKDFFLLKDNEWYSYRTKNERDEKELFYDNDIEIYDLDNKKRIIPKEFFAGDYAVDEEEDSDYAKKHNLRDWYGYIYTDGDRISSIVVTKNMDSLYRQRITNGIVKADPVDDSLTGWTLELRDVKDWSERKEEWMMKNSDLRMSLEKTMIIKDGKLISPDELTIGMRLYIIRDDFKGKVVLVK
ncbi:hypothetical protein IZY60_02995 [Lutibacter sp. B2]|nr:hypothetical protein [Lutibacter sp. B2]